MKRYIRETHEVLEGLGFVRHDDPFGRTDRAAYSHPYEPETRIQVYAGATDVACKAIQARAHQIAGLGTSGPKTVGERRKDQRKNRSRNRTDEQRKERARQQRAERAEREWEQRQALAASDQHRREIEDLMRPGGAR